jgi:hypothetical protein
MNPEAALHERQGTPLGLLLQRAADGSHAVAYRIEAVRLVISIAFGIAAIMSTAWPTVAKPIGAASALWAGFSFVVLAVWSQRETTAAALAQESFDTWLYGLPWTTASRERPLAEEELRRRARKSRLPEERLATWYPDVSGLAAPYQVLTCQRENLSWDWRLRRRYATALVVAIAAWIALGVLIGLVGDLSVRDLVVRWFVPSSSLLLFAAQQVRGHREIAAEKEQLTAEVRAELDAADNVRLSREEEARLWQRCRLIQDGLLRARKRDERVPRWLFERYRDNDELDMRETAAATRERLTP